MPRICVMDGVREYGAEHTVELHRDDDSGRLVVVATNEGGYNATYVDLIDLLDWVERGSSGVILKIRAVTDGNASPGGGESAEGAGVLLGPGPRSDTS